MKFLKNQHQRKSFLITALMVALILFLFSFVGLKYIDPPIEYGMEVNFGTIENGNGKKVFKKEIIDSKIQELDSNNDNNSVEKSSKTKSVPSKIVTQDNSDYKIIDKKNNDSLKTIDKKNDIKLAINNIKIDKPKVSEATKSIISNLMSSEVKLQIPEAQGEGEGGYDTGKLEGDPYSTIYYGQEGKGGQGVGYGLSGRSLQVNGKEKQSCNESGIVVVRIVVNKTGEVISANPGVKGTTNSNPCLLEPAKSTALMHKWYPDQNAPEKQIGYVVIEFKLVE